MVKFFNGGKCKTNFCKPENFNGGRCTDKIANFLYRRHFNDKIPKDKKGLIPLSLYNDVIKARAIYDSLRLGYKHATGNKHVKKANIDYNLKVFYFFNIFFRI